MVCVDLRLRVSTVVLVCVFILCNMKILAYRSRIKREIITHLFSYILTYNNNNNNNNNPIYVTPLAELQDGKLT